MKIVSFGILIMDDNVFCNISTQLMLSLSLAHHHKQILLTSTLQTAKETVDTTTSFMLYGAMVCSNI